MGPDAVVRRPSALRRHALDALVLGTGLAALVVYLVRGRIGGGFYLSVVLGLDLLWLLLRVALLRASGGAS